MSKRTKATPAVKQTQKLSTLNPDASGRAHRVVPMPPSAAFRRAERLFALNNISHAIRAAEQVRDQARLAKARISNLQSPISNQQLTPRRAQQCHNSDEIKRSAGERMPGY